MAVSHEPITSLRPHQVTVGDRLWNLTLVLFVLVLCVFAVLGGCSRSSTSPEPCFQFIGSAGSRPILLNRCTGAVTVGESPDVPTPPPPQPPPQPPPTTPLPRLGV